MPSLLGLYSKALLASKGHRGSEDLPQCLIEPLPADFKMDPLLAKAKPISNGGSTSEITFYEGKNPAQLKPEE